MTEKKSPPTPFQQRVYEACKKIPEGKVTTYKELGRAIGCASPRAIGQALRRNPFAPVVPCHRVVASDLKIGGFNGHRNGPEIGRKKKLLASEGVEVTPDDQVQPLHLYRFKRED